MKLFLIDLWEYLEVETSDFAHKKIENQQSHNIWNNTKFKYAKNCHQNICLFLFIQKIA